jgi:hypothetical protein
MVCEVENSLRSARIATLTERRRLAIDLHAPFGPGWIPPLESPSFANAVVVSVDWVARTSETTLI